jgi:DNA-binding IclR family transcriptional regulator
MNEKRRRVPRPDRELAQAVEASKAPAISRAAAVLRLLGKNATPLGVQAIARELGLVPSTCLHVLRALVAEEFVSFDSETKRSPGTGSNATASPTSRNPRWIAWARIST